MSADEMAKYEAGYKPPLGPPNPSNPVVFFEIQAGSQVIGTVEMEVKTDVVPKTADNFVQLATEQTPGKGYNQCPFHRIIPDFMCQGGDFTNKNGTGGRSIYGEKFPDENFKLGHQGPGVLSMANAGRNTNGSQFFLCTATTPWLNAKHVVFGQVIKGYGVVKAMEGLGSGSGKTSKPVMISACGVKK